MTLEGIWAAVTTPFDDDERFDEDIFRENVRRLHAAGVHGIYTTDADGEFYALELDEFARLVDVFADEAARLGFQSQVGVTWSSTRGVLDRLQHCVRRGITGAHVGHPMFMRMTTDSWLSFWEDVAAVVPDDFGLVHYNTPKLPNYLTADEYGRLADRIPNLAGTKYVGSDVVEFAALVRHAPRLSHFVGEQSFGFLAPYGARGIYSWFANFNPAFVLSWYDDVRTGRWELVVQKQQRMLEFIEAARVLTARGHEHAVIGKALSSASSFLVPSRASRRPYLPISEEVVELWRQTVLERFQDLVWSG